MPVKDTLDWARFSRAIYISTTPATAYGLWATGAGLTRWWLARARYFSPAGEAHDKKYHAQKGDRFEWSWYEGTVLTGHVIEANGKDHFAFTFGGKVVVHVHLKVVGDRMLVELDQEGMANNPAGQKFYIGCTTAWAAYLTNMRSVLEGGLDLREKKPDRENLVNA
ncbi:MAG: SRPBCC family protein [Planctomycetota bacterium]